MRVVCMLLLGAAVAGTVKPLPGAPGYARAAPASPTPL